MKKSTKLRTHKSKAVSKQNRKKRSTRRRHTTGLPDGPPLTPEQQSLLATLLSDNHGWMLAEAIGMGLREPDIPVVNALVKTAIRYDPALAPPHALLRFVFACELAGAYRSQVRRGTRLLPLPADYQQIPDEYQAEAWRAQQRYKELRAAMRCLPLNDQRLLKLCYEGLILDDIAAFG